jgi:hypothetical protein
MLYQTAKVENGQMKIVESKVIEQSKLSSECWTVQFQGLKACKDCESRGKDCGGVNIRKTGKNAYGIKVPVSG